MSRQNWGPSPIAELSQGEVSLLLCFETNRKRSACSLPARFTGQVANLADNRCWNRLALEAAAQAGEEYGGPKHTRPAGKTRLGDDFYII